MRENINSNFYILSVKYTYNVISEFLMNPDNTITSSRSNKSMTHFLHLRKIRYFTHVIIIKPLIYIFQVLASRESLVESLEESESDDAILMSQVSDSFSFRVRSPLSWSIRA